MRTHCLVVVFAVLGAYRDAPPVSVVFIPALAVFMRVVAYRAGVCVGRHVVWGCYGSIFDYATWHRAVGFTCCGADAAMHSGCFFGVSRSPKRRLAPCKATARKIHGLSATASCQATAAELALYALGWHLACIVCDGCRRIHCGQFFVLHLAMAMLLGIGVCASARWFSADAPFIAPLWVFSPGAGSCQDIKRNGVSTFTGRCGACARAFCSMTRPLVFEGPGAMA